MKWIPDRSGAFPRRLYFETLLELDTECERLLSLVHYDRLDSAFQPPLSDDALQVLIEHHADLDLYADLPEGVEGVTEFRRRARPLIRMNAVLANDPSRRNRLRTGLAHEWFHAVFHRSAWEMRWARAQAKGSAEVIRASCHRDTVVGASEREWMEFQAGYASCALLMPRRFARTIADAMRSEGADELAIVERLATTFEVSTQAARWRLSHLGRAE